MNHLASGEYRPGDSILHSLDSAIKLMCFLLLLLAALTTDTPAGYTGMLLFTAWKAGVLPLNYTRTSHNANRL